MKQGILTSNYKTHMYFIITVFIVNIYFVIGRMQMIEELN